LKKAEIPRKWAESPEALLPRPEIRMEGLHSMNPSKYTYDESDEAEVEIPLYWTQDGIDGDPLDGIISYLTKKHGGNVHDKGIVTITSKSVDDRYFRVKTVGPTRVADFTSGSYFASKNDPGQWVCWDFREMRVRPTHYTIQAEYLKSWVVEGSLDGKSWTEIDRQTNNQDFNVYAWKTGSFAVSKPAECRFIRLRQTDKRYDGYKRPDGYDILELYAVEFFGTLSE
jgi:hypothetical protein